MEPRGERMIIKFNIPSRGIIGLRNQLLTATAGEAIMAHRFLQYQPYKGRNRGSYQRFVNFYGKRKSDSLLDQQITGQR